MEKIDGIIEDVIYGVILRANTDIFSNEPPVKALKKLYASLVAKLPITDWIAD